MSLWFHQRTNQDTPMTSTARLIHSLFAVSLLLLAGESAFAKTTYKCKTSTGTTIYTATPALGQQCSKMTLNGIAPPTQTSAAISNSRKPAAATALSTDPVAAKQPAASQADCDTSRKAIDMLQSGQRTYETDEKGERHYLDDAQRTERTQQHQTLLNTRCSK
jgi:hypothetical protein